MVERINMQIIVCDEKNNDIKLYTADNFIDTKNYKVLLQSRDNEDYVIECPCTSMPILALSNGKNKIELDANTMEMINKYNTIIDDKYLDGRVKRKRCEVNKLEKKIEKIKRLIPDLEVIIDKYIVSDYDELNKW